MLWLTWRQFRTQAAAVFAGVLAVGVVVAITGPELADLYRGQGTAFLSQLTSTDGTLYYCGIVVTYVVPAVIGGFWGAPLVTRELETGTHSLVWNQTITRTRWLATKLGLTGLAAVAVAGLLSLAVTWWAGPIDSAAGAIEHESFEPRIAPLVFGARGIVPIGYAAFAFVLGVAAGILLRRTVAAMAVTLAVFTTIQVVAPIVVRPYLIPPVQDTVTITENNIRGIRVTDANVVEELVAVHPPGIWLLDEQTVDPAGRVVTNLTAAASECQPPPLPGQGGGPPDSGSIEACFAKLADLGYQQRLTYQPASRFWALQWIETAVFLTLSALLTWFCFRWTRHRLS